MKMKRHCSVWGIYPAFGWIVAGVLMMAKGNVGIYGGDVGAGAVISGIGVIWILVWLFTAFKKSD